MPIDVLRLFGEVSNNLDCMKRFIGQYYVLVASDIARDGLGVELWDNEHNLVAEVFRCDANNTALLNTFNNDVPLNVLQSLIQFARERLEPFEDGSPLPKAEPMQSQ
jgi:hypothetical protein